MESDAAPRGETAQSNVATNGQGREDLDSAIADRGNDVLGAKAPAKLKGTGAC